MQAYNLVIKSDLKEFITKVNEAVLHGYVPIGGIIHVDGMYIQAIYLSK